MQDMHALVVEDDPDISSALVETTPSGVQDQNNCEPGMPST